MNKLININLQFHIHAIDPLPFDTPVLIMQPSCSETNVCMVFGNKPAVYTAKTANKVQINYTDVDFLTKALIYSSDNDMVYSATDWMKLRILWCKRPMKATTNLQQVLLRLDIKNDVHDTLEVDGVEDGGDKPFDEE